jgi:hypothetical protein
MLLDGRSRVNIIIKQLKATLGLPKPNHAPCNLLMANQIAKKPVGLIKDLKTYVHGILYITTFTIL